MKETNKRADGNLIETFHTHEHIMLKQEIEVLSHNFTFINIYTFITHFYTILNQKSSYIGRME